MAPVNNVVPVVCHTSSDVKLAEKAASLAAPSASQKARAKIVEELLAQLQKEKRRRELRGLNHWDRHAPMYLARIAKQRESARRAAIVRFIATRHEDALQYAYRITANWDLAEQALSQTYVELLEHRTTRSYFLRALKFNARNLMDSLVIERERCQSLEAKLAVARRGEESGKKDEDPGFISPHGEDQDPLDILIAREDAKMLAEDIRRARAMAETNRKFWWIRQKKWAKELGIGSGLTQ